MTRQTMHRSTADRSRTMNPPLGVLRDELDTILDRFVRSPSEIGRASCRERVCLYV